MTEKKHTGGAESKRDTEGTVSERTETKLDVDGPVSERAESKRDTEETVSERDEAKTDIEEAEAKLDVEGAELDEQARGAEAEAKTEAVETQVHTTAAAAAPKKGLMQRRKSFLQTSVPNAHRGYNPKTPRIMLGIIAILLIASFILAAVTA